MTIAGRQVLKSVAWSSGGALSMRLGQFLIGIIAARILLPHDFRCSRSPSRSTQSSSM